MSQEVDLRLVALGLVPAPTEPQAQAATTTVEPPPSTVAPQEVAPTSEAPPLFAGMGKFTGMPAEAPAPEPLAPASAQFMTPTISPTYTPPPVSKPPTPYTPPPTPPRATPAYTPPSYTAPPVAPPVPEAPVREAPPPLPPLAASIPTAVATAEAPAVPMEKGKPKRERKLKVPKAPKAAPAAKVERERPAPPPRFVLPASGVLLRGPIVMGYPEQKLQITLEQLGFRINAREPIEVAWSDVKEIKTRRGRVSVRIKGAKPIAFGIPIEGVSEPTLSGPLARVVKEASSGSLDLAGSAFLELQNATDSLKDQFHDEDDPLVPTVVGLVFGLAGLTFTALLPDALAIATRTPIPPGAYLLDYPLAPFDPRILLAAFAGGSMLAAGIVRVAMGRAATAWARGTLRGWHDEPRRAVELGRRGLAAIVLNPAIAAALCLLAIVLTLPSTRIQTVIDPGGMHLMRALPFFDEDRPWSTVTEITTVPAPTFQHFEGVAVVFRFQNNSTVSTLDAHLRGGTDKQLLASATAWREGRSKP